MGSNFFVVGSLDERGDLPGAAFFRLAKIDIPMKKCIIVIFISDLISRIILTPSPGFLPTALVVGYRCN